MGRSDYESAVDKVVENFLPELCGDVQLAAYILRRDRTLISLERRGDFSDNVDQGKIVGDEIVLRLPGRSDLGGVEGLQVLCGKCQLQAEQDYEPGDIAQVDFGSSPTITDVMTGEVFKTWFFVMTLAWSRHQYVEIVTDQKVLTWLGCHRRAFEFFGGVPTKVVIDNLKAAITKACWHDPTVQRSYADFAEGYGFIISPCPPRDPKKKGIVEAGVKYVKRNFLPLREFRSLADANQQIWEWNLTTAAARIHGTTRQQPIKLFLDTEKHLLKKLPHRPVELAAWAKVKLHGNCHVQFEKSFYSAPYRWVRRELWLQATENSVKIFRNHQLVAVHSRAQRPGQKFTSNDHLPPEALAYKMQDPQWCLKQAEEIGPFCRMVIERLFNNGVLDNLRSAQGIVRTLKNKYKANRLEAACKRALLYDNPRYKTVKSILEKQLDYLEDPPATPQNDPAEPSSRP